MRRGAVLALVGFLIVAPCHVSMCADSGHNFDYWEPAIAAFEQVDRTNPPPQGALLFVGSSTIVNWKTLAQDFPDNRVINRGFGGSEIVDVTHFAERIIFPYKPRMIFLRSGINDIDAGLSTQEVFADFKDFEAKVHATLPEREIVFISLNPSIAFWSQADKQKELNTMIKQFIDVTPRMKYIEIYDLPLGPDGRPRPELFQPDGLHFNAAGYKLLAERVRPYLPTENTPLPSPAVRVDGNDASVTYGGAYFDSTGSEWNNGTMRLIDGARDYAQITFTGTAIKWVGMKQFNLGIADVYLDGVLAQAGIDAYDPGMVNRVELFNRTGLANTSHTLQVIQTGNQNASSTGTRIPVDYFQYDQPSPPIPIPVKVDGSDGSVIYSGAYANYAGSQWYNSTMRLMDATGGSAQLTFAGTSVKWIGMKQFNLGIADLFLDGVRVQAGIDTYNPGIVNSVELFSRTALENNWHTIEIVETGKKNAASTGARIPLDYLEYTSSDQSTVANNDNYGLLEDSTLTVAAPGVLANDTDAQSNPLNAILVNSVGHGTLDLNSNGSFTYTPTANYSGPDSFTYKANDGDLDSNLATVNLTVTPMNDPPTLNLLSNLTINQNAGLQTVDLSGITAGSGEGQTLTVTASSSNPGLIANPSVTYASPDTTGRIVFSPAANASGTATISVQVADNGGTTSGGIDTITRTFLVLVAVNPATSASFVAKDTTTQGSWKGKYGSDGYNIINHAVQYPGYATVTPSGTINYTWASSTSNMRALQKPASTTDRVAAGWYSASSFTVDLNLTDGNSHRIALYCVDWDTTARAETIEILNASNNSVLSSQSVTAFNGGQYLVWNIQGHVLIRLTRTGSFNAVLSALFFDSAIPTTRALTINSSNPNSEVSITVSPADTNIQRDGVTPFTRLYNNNTGVTLTAPATASGNNFAKWQRNGVDWSNTLSTTVTLDADYTMTAVYLASSSTQATFVRKDTTTQGNWKGVYGAEGYNLINFTVNYPSYATAVASGKINHIWASSTSDLRGLRKPASSTDRVAADWYSSSSFTVDLNLTDGFTHRVALYCVDWDTTARAETIEILDASNPSVLSSQNVTAFHGGQYLLWDIRGHVLIRLTRTGSYNAVLSGIFFDPSP